MRVLLLTPFRGERIALEELLREEGHEVTSVASRSAAVEWATAYPLGVVIADALVPNADGLALVDEISSHSPLEIILLCTRSDRLDREGVTCLTKPIDLYELTRRLDPGRPTEARVA